MEDCAGENCPIDESPIPVPIAWKVVCVIRLLLLFLRTVMMYRTTNTTAATTATVPRTMPTMSPVDRAELLLLPLELPAELLTEPPEPLEPPKPAVPLLLLDPLPVIAVPYIFT